MKVLEGKRILLVDDEFHVREALGWMLNLDNHVVAKAANAAQALDWFAPGQFDLVITDMRMPGTSGAELAAQIKRIAPDQLILMLTALPEISPGPDNPVDGVLMKPPPLRELRQAIADLFETGS